MAQVLPIQFRSTGGVGVTPSFDFFDIAEGTGIVKFYGVAIDTGTGTLAYRLTTDATAFSYGDPTQSTWGKTFFSKVADSAGTEEINWDITFNAPEIMKGKTRITCFAPIESTNNDSTMQIKVRLIKWDGSTETEVGAQVSSQDVTVVAGTGDSFFVLEVPFDAQTKFKKGETLRIELIMNYDLGVASTDFNIFHSPANLLTAAAPTGATSQFIVEVPFVIDL